MCSYQLKNIWSSLFMILSHEHQNVLESAMSVILKASIDFSKQSIDFTNTRKNNFFSSLSLTGEERMPEV